jgi:hypothetical protein
MLFGYVQRDLFENSRDSAARDAELGRETAGRSEPGAGAKLPTATACRNAAESCR